MAKIKVFQGSRGRFFKKAPWSPKAMSSPTIYFTRFLPTIDRGGGSRRMMQIWELIKGVENECEVVSTQRLDRLSQEALLRIEENLTVKSKKKYRFWSEKRRESAYRLEEISREWSHQITREINGLKLVIMDDPIYFIPLFQKLKHLEVPVIGICHNLESLAPEQVANDPRGTFFMKGLKKAFPGWESRPLFNKEIDLLAKCDMVITISREETVLLRNLGINTVFYPYYPVEPVLNRLLQVREKRKETGKKGILLLGNVLNLQTRQGMEKMIDDWQASGFSREQGKLIVAGYGTGKYLKKAGSSAIEFLGDLSNDELDNLLTRVKACLCYQEGGSGALTRICEMLTAGVPVLANSHAARSYYHMNGVIEFQESKELGGAIKQVEKWEGNIPVPPAPGVPSLIAGIKKIIMNNR